MSAADKVSRREVTFTVNGKACCVSAYPMQRLLDVLRGELGLTGTKEGCGEGECGSCSVLLNGELVNSCLVPVLQAQSAEICTIEGLATRSLHPIQQAFLECGGAQCGICTPGMIMATVHLLKAHPNPSMEQIREGLSGNLCRCTGYSRIFHAVQESAKQIAAAEMGPEPGSQIAGLSGEDAMRSIPSAYELVAPETLAFVLELLAGEPGAWLPIAGGTEIMVQYGAGRLAAHKLVSIWGLPELRQIKETADELHIGAGCTYTDLRKHPVIAGEFPLLCSGASWTGSIANQNRGTLGGNIINASPAADSLPALLAYEAELLLVSSRGERRVPYLGFHTGYKRTSMLPEELIRTIVLQRKFAGYASCSRKVGQRNAQAISKLCMAALVKADAGIIQDARVAFGSMAPVPLRLRETERVLLGARWNAETLSAARRALQAEVAPIDDIRSTSAYRIKVAGNLLEEFLQSLFLHENNLGASNS